MTSDATLEGSGVRKGRCRLGVEAGSQKLIMIQACVAHERLQSEEGRARSGRV
jgi:hypothetical protein